MPEIEKLVDIINDFFGCDAAYFDVNPFDLATHLISKGVKLSDELTAVESSNAKHGHWIYKPYEGDETVWLYHCSVCGHPNARERKYCNECGAAMDGDHS